MVKNIEKKIIKNINEIPGVVNWSNENKDLLFETIKNEKLIIEFVKITNIWHTKKNYGHVDKCHSNTTNKILLKDHSGYLCLNINDVKKSYHSDDFDRYSIDLFQTNGISNDDAIGVIYKIKSFYNNGYINYEKYELEIYDY